MVVNVAINIKVEILFQGVNVFREGGINSTRGRKYFLWGRGNISSPGDFVIGETIFRDTGTFSEEGGQEINRCGNAF